MPKICEHRYDIHFDREYLKRVVAVDLLRHIHNELTTHYCTRMMPIIKSSTKFDNGIWKNHVRDVYNKYINDPQYTIYKYLENSILFDFHFDEWYANGTIASCVGKHDYNASKELYIQQLLDAKSKLERLGEIAKSCDYSIGCVQETIPLLGYYAETEKYLRRDLFNDFNGDCYAVDRNNVLNLFIIVQDNSSDEELLELYNKYPMYKDKYGTGGYPYLHYGSCIQKHQELFEYIMTINNKLINSLIRKADLNSYRARSESTTCNDPDDTVHKFYYNYTCDQQAFNEYVNSNNEQLLNIALETELDDKYPELIVMQSKLKQLKSSDEVLIRLNTNHDKII